MTACQADDRFTSDDPDERDEAAQLCSTCPSKATCLVGALERKEPWGVWGGVDMQPGKTVRGENQAHPPCAQCGKELVKRYGEGAARFRARMFCDRDCSRAAVAEANRRFEIVHGTEAGARAHQRRGERPCLPCSEAQRQAKNRRETGRAA